MQAYSDPTRENDQTALPDVEVFRVTRGSSGLLYINGEIIVRPDAEEAVSEPGWYYWFCFPGCMPDSDPIGPFATKDEALDDAREGRE